MCIINKEMMNVLCYGYWKKVTWNLCIKIWKKKDVDKNSGRLGPQKLALAWWRLRNFIGRHMKFNSFLHPNEQAQRIFWCFVKRFDWKPSKIGIFWYSKSIFNVKTQLNLSENDFLFSIYESRLFIRLSGNDFSSGSWHFWL